MTFFWGKRRVSLDRIIRLHLGQMGMKRPVIGANDVVINHDDRSAMLAGNVLELFFRHITGIYINVTIQVAVALIFQSTVSPAFPSAGRRNAERA